MRTLTKACLSFAAFVACASASSATGSPEPNRIVYWGNTITGKSVRVFNTADAGASSQLISAFHPFLPLGRKSVLSTHCGHEHACAMTT